MRFSLLDPTNKYTLIFPVTPEKLDVEMGVKTISYSHLRIGESEFPSGSTPLTLSFKGILQSDIMNIPKSESKTKADTIINKIRAWQKEDRKKLRLIITGTPWNVDVFIDSFQTNYAGKLITFSITLKEYRTIIINHTKQKPKKRPVSKPKPRTYTVKRGDNLWNIAKRYTGKGFRWTEMWAINKTKSRSKNPNLIYPGEVFAIPAGW